MAVEERVMWAARAYAGEYLRSPDELGLLSTRFGGRAWPEDTALPFDDASKCLLCLLSDLKVASRYYLPIDPSAKPTRFMTVFVERLARPEDMRGETVARFDIVRETGYASASVLLKGMPRVDGGPVPCDERDGAWEIMLKLLEAMYPKVSDT